MGGKTGGRAAGGGAATAASAVTAATASRCQQATTAPADSRQRAQQQLTARRCQPLSTSITVSSRTTHARAHISTGFRQLGQQPVEAADVAAGQVQVEEGDVRPPGQQLQGRESRNMRRTCGRLGRVQPSIPRALAFTTAAHRGVHTAQSSLRQLTWPCPHMTHAPGSARRI